MLVDKCFGMELKKDYELAIEQCMIDYRNCIHDNVILKAHILEVHTTTFFERQKSLVMRAKASRASLSMISTVSMTGMSHGRAAIKPGH